MADDLATAATLDAMFGECPCPVSERPAWLAPLSDPRNEPILMAAFQMFVEKGFAGATMLDIATCAKVSKETIYDRFENKDGLFYALLAWAGRQAGVDPSEYTDALVTNDPVGALENFAVSTWNKMSRPEAIDITRVAFGEARRNQAVAGEFHTLVTAGSMDVLPRIVVALNAQGLAQIDDPDEFYHAFIGLLKGCQHQAILLSVEGSPSDDDAEAWARRAVRRLLKAFA